MPPIYYVFEVCYFILLVGAVLLLKSYLPKYFEEKGKNLATKEDIGAITDEVEKVKIQYTKDIEILKSELLRQSHSHKVRYEYEFNILTEIWDALIYLRNKTLSLRPAFDKYTPGETEKERKTIRLNQFSDAYTGLIDKVDKNKPFYPSSIHSKLIDLTGLLRQEAIDFGHLSPNSNSDYSYDPKYWEKAVSNSKLIIDSIEEICEVIRERVAS
mgnify:CR=1 FL=1